MSVNSFEALTSSFPNQIDLSWSLSATLSVNEQVVIKRSESIYPLFNEGDEIYRSSLSTVTTFEDKNLTDDTYFYYAIYIENTVTLVTTEQSPDTRDFALSYKKWGEGRRLYDLIPSGIQEVNYFHGDHLKRLVDVIGNMMDYYRSFVTTMGYWRRPELVAENMLDFYSEMFGFPPERGFDLRVLRNLALGLVATYKKKGTCQGLVDFTKMFTTWDSRCDDTVDLTFRTWDPETKRNLAVQTGVGGNRAIDSISGFPSNLWTNGKFVDESDDPFYKILGNDSDEIFFLDKTPPFTRLDGTTGSGTSTVVFQDLTQTWTVGQWRGHRLYIPAFSTTEYWSIVDNTATTLTCNPLWTNYGPSGLDVFREVGLDLAAPAPGIYRIEPEYYVQQGRHSLLYDNTVPPGFRGLTKDPAHFLVGGNRSLLSLGDFSPLSVILIIQGVSPYVGRSTGLLTTTLTDTNANFGAVNSLVGLKLNPNILQAEDFEIVSNTSTTITVSGDLLEVAASGNNYYVINPTDSTKARRLRQVLPDFAPYYAEIFVFFEPI